MKFQYSETLWRINVDRFGVGINFFRGSFLNYWVKTLFCRFVLFWGKSIIMWNYRVVLNWIMNEINPHCREICTCFGSRVRSKIVRRCIIDFQRFSFCREFIISGNFRWKRKSCKFSAKFSGLLKYPSGAKKMVWQNFNSRWSIKFKLIEDINHFIRDFFSMSNFLLMGVQRVILM